MGGRSDGEGRGTGSGSGGGRRPVEGLGSGEAGPRHILHPLRKTFPASRPRGPSLHVSIYAKKSDLDHLIRSLGVWFLAFFRCPVEGAAVEVGVEGGEWRWCGRRGGSGSGGE